eukprot:TRINITY_DN83661_c0_g1_i1.p1 TRINITY_DN83661_c0_g1~~TRINITY_DN83661_c0_g1_i1.p1  ORF type:complete len:111 (-),score=38.79 TRINITY_DN83661_c0_g1_i1:30-362(-)
MIACKEREAEQLPDDITALRQLKETELLRLHHLERSNQELAEALAAAEDADLREAFQDNVVAIEQKQARISEIERWIQQIIVAKASVNRAAAGIAEPDAPTAEFADGIHL